MRIPSPNFINNSQWLLSGTSNCELCFVIVIVKTEYSASPTYYVNLILRKRKKIISD